MNISVSDLQLFQLLKPKLGEKEAEAIVQFVESKVKSNNETFAKGLATKEDVSKLEVSVAETKSDIIRWIFGFFLAITLMIFGLYLKA